jgi:hypothetical protein
MNEARDKIAKILEDKIELFYDFLMGFDEAADAIIAALPDMIAPLVWAKSELLKRSDSGWYFVQHTHCSAGIGVWSMYFGDCLESSHETEKKAKEAADAHNRDEFRKRLNPPSTGETS